MAVAEKVGVAGTAADFFKRRAGKATGDGLMSFLRKEPGQRQKIALDHKNLPQVMNCAEMYKDREFARLEFAKHSRFRFTCTCESHP